MSNLNEVRCAECGALLCKENIEVGEIEIKCHYCNAMNTQDYNSRIMESIFTAVMA